MDTKDKDLVEKEEKQEDNTFMPQKNMVLGPENHILVYPGYYIPIHKLNGKEVKIWNGIEWSLAKVKQVTPVTRLLQISYNDGTLIRCGFDQKSIMLTKNTLDELNNRKIIENDIKDAIRVSVPYLVPGMTVLQGCKISYAQRDIEKEEFKLAYNHGVYATTGVSSHIKLEDEQLKLVHLTFLENERLGCYKRMIYENINNILDVKIIYNKDYVPLKEGLDIRAGWFSGLIDSRAIIMDDCIIISYTDINFLFKVKLLADSLGIQCVLRTECNKLNINPNLRHKDDGEYNNMIVNNISYYNLGFNWKAIRKIQKLCGSAVFDFAKLLTDKPMDKLSINIESIKYAEAFDAAYKLEENETKTNACIVSGILMGT